MAKKKKDDKWMNIGNYKVCIQENRNGRILICKDVAGLWSISWREGSKMFVSMSQLIDEYAKSDNEVIVNYVSTIIWFYHYCTSNFFSIEYMEEYIKWFDGCQLRMNQVQEISKEDDDKIVQDIVEMREVEEELEKLEEENEVH